jgi:hypothetical protein
MRLLVALALVATFGCATTTRLHTHPEGATVYINGLLVGQTPLAYTNEAGLPRRYHLEIDKEGYESLDFYVDTRLSWLWGFVGLVTVVPYFWAWSLRGDYVFHLEPKGEGLEVLPQTPHDLFDENEKL